ncbi:hypothetical protein SHXM_06869 [Streptomyces hygroscopicus]|nr:hypothetical protein SHXM_06869 [Streptomyces hygroscopicus]
MPSMPVLVVVAGGGFSGAGVRPSAGCWPPGPRNAFQGGRSVGRRPVPLLRAVGAPGQGAVAVRPELPSAEAPEGRPPKAVHIALPLSVRLVACRLSPVACPPHHGCGEGADPYQACRDKRQATSDRGHGPTVDRPGAARGCSRSRPRSAKSSRRGRPRVVRRRRSFLLFPRDVAVPIRHTEAIRHTITPSDLRCGGVAAVADSQEGGERRTVDAGAGSGSHPLPPPLPATSIMALTCEVAPVAEVADLRGRGGGSSSCSGTYPLHEADPLQKSCP